MLHIWFYIIICEYSTKNKLLISHSQFIQKNNFLFESNKCYDGWGGGPWDRYSTMSNRRVEKDKENASRHTTTKLEVERKSQDL